MMVRIKILFVLLLGLTTASIAVAANTDSIRTPLPIVKIAKPGQCVAQTDEMRRNHMEKILHQRDLTMHDGIRTKKHSLSNCIDCHADQKTNSVLGKEGFCESCHTYSAVSIDCFSCHNHKRETKAATSNEEKVSQ
jgi:hypothetical protein